MVVIGVQISYYDIGVASIVNYVSSAAYLCMLAEVLVHVSVIGYHNRVSTVVVVSFRRNYTACYHQVVVEDVPIVQIYFDDVHSDIDGS